MMAIKQHRKLSDNTLMVGTTQLLEDGSIVLRIELICPRCKEVLVHHEFAGEDRRKVATLARSADLAAQAVDKHQETCQ